MSRWKKILVSTFIGGYIAFLSWGIVAHTLHVGASTSTLNYFVVWDMFCGWSAWDSRTHVIAEGVSGQYYDVREPWGEFRPFGNVARIQYDSTNQLLPRHISHVLSHSDHEEIARVYVVEEVWPKQHNLPPALYAHYFNRPSDKQSYFHLRGTFTDQGDAMTLFPAWHIQQGINAICENPRLQRQARQATGIYSTLFTPNSQSRGASLGAELSGLATN